ncbi:beta-arrestin-2 isoform X5 [Trachypithecus francoisi]|uniref:beta-arrestin-2 isoform X5 n=1 Tax=Trachypithecus francoisi TaxID=54180 RepID=UPI00141B1971|nr:beta-arrestin-2 isoform X5 [Trachypithecus francoisi]
MGEKPGTRVFKKSSPNCKLTVYLGKRDFVDHLDKVDPVDGVVLVDPDYLKDRKVFVTLTCAFRYGREDLDVLGLSFRKDLFIATYQAFPPVPNPPRPPTRLQDRLLRKLGQHAHPFFFTIPQNLPCSVTLQPGPEDTGKACGVDFEIRAFCAKSLEEKSHKRNSVRLVIRKVQFAPEKPGPQPSAETTRHFLMSDRSLHLEASLDKELYYHGEPLNVNVHVTNNSTKTVKKIKVSVRQYADICLFSTAQYKCPVAQLEQDDQREGGCQQGGAGNPGVLQGQGEAGGVSRRGCLCGAAFCSYAPQAPRPHPPPQTPVSGSRDRRPCGHQPH